MIRIIPASLRNVPAASNILKPHLRSFSVSSRLYLKEIHEEKQGNTLVIKGVYVKSPRENVLLKTDNEKGACPLCASGLEVRHTDVLIVKQFVGHDGQILPKQVTGLCGWQYRKMRFIVEMARRAGLIKPLLPPGEPIPDYQKGWRRYNTYYDESLIRKSKLMMRQERENAIERAYQLAKAEEEAHERKLLGES